MTNRVLGLLVPVAVSVVVGPVFSQQVQPLSLDLKDADAQEVLMTFARLAESRLVLSPEITGKVTFRFNGVSWQTALTAITHGLDAVWELETTPSRSLVVRPEDFDDEVANRINISLVRASVEEVFGAFATMQGLAIDFDPAIAGNVTLSLERVGAATAQDAVCESAGCSWTQRDGLLVVDRRGDHSSGEVSKPSDQNLSALVNLDLIDAAVEEVLSSIATLLGVELLVDSTLRGTTTMTLQGVSVREALDRVCADGFLDWGLVQRADGWALKISPVVADTWQTELDAKRR